MTLVDQAHRLDGIHCAWFLMCDNPAIGHVAHPVLGDVPVCGRCVAKLDLALVQR